MSPTLDVDSGECRQCWADHEGNQSRTLRGSDRGQTVLDYGIAVSIFVIALVFVLGTIPGMFAPFTGNSGGAQTADRVAKSLSADVLGAPLRPYVLNATCTVGFFDQLNGGPSAADSCRFDTNATDLPSVLALDSTTGIRVEITNLDGTVATIDGTSLEAGGTLPKRSTVTSARRTVGIDGQTYTLEVHVW